MRSESFRASHIRSSEFGVRSYVFLNERIGFSDTENLESYEIFKFFGLRRTHVGVRTALLQLFILAIALPVANCGFSDGDINLTKIDAESY